MTNRDRDLNWKTSTYCEGGACVEVAIEPDLVFLRDSKDPSGPQLVFGPDEWRTLMNWVKQSDID